MADSSSTFTPEAHATPPPPRAPYSSNDGGLGSSAEEGAACSARDSWHDGGMGVAGAWVRRRTRRARRLARRRPWEGRGAQGGPCDGGRARGSTAEAKDKSDVWVPHVSGREGKESEPGVLLSFYLSI